jgi:uracil-DNA glycosylase family 4
MGFFSNIESRGPDCSSCGLYEHAKSPKMGVFGEGKKKILILGKAPSVKQDLENNLFEGEATDLLRKELKSNGINLERDCWRLDALGCRVGKISSVQLENKVKACKARVEKYIGELKPSLIICLGSSALNQIAKGRMSDVQLISYQGKVYPDYKYNSWVGALPHPAFLTMPDEHGNCLFDDNYYMSFFRRMVSKTLLYIDKKLPVFHNISNKVQVLTDYNDVVSVLEGVLNRDLLYLAYDYETNTASSFLPEIRVESIAVTDNKSIAWAFPFERDGVYTPEQLQHIKSLWIKIISRKHVLKIVHNMGLEYNFDAIYFGVDVDNYYDTMVGVHQLDVTPNTKGLKFQLSIRYGIESYDDEISPYLVPHDINSYNEIHKCPLNKLLTYNGIDTLGGYWLWEDIYKELHYNTTRSFEQRECDKLYQSGYKALCRSHRKGVDVDIDFLKEEEKYLFNLRDEYIKKVHSSDAGKLYKSKTGKNLEITNNNEIGRLVYEFMGIAPIRTTPTGKGQATKEALEELRLDFINDLLYAKQIEKHRNDFVSKLLHNHTNGKIYPEIGVSHARTGRSNAFGVINIQQIPKRTELTKRVRKALIAPPGYRFVCRDYGSVEVITNALCSGDPILKQYIRDGADPHHDNAKLAYMMSDEQVTKKIRQFTKQAWTFLLFYKGYPSSSAKRIIDGWEHLITGDGFTLKEHFAINGIKDFFSLRDHCIEKADQMWNRFSVFHEYQSTKEQEYFKKGYVSTPMGFRRGGFVTPNMTINSPAQGLGFQIVLDSYVALDEWLTKSMMESYLCFQIHDDIVHIVKDTELQEVLETGHYIMTDRLNEKYDWIDIPLTVDTEVSPIGGSWYDVQSWDKNENGIWEVKK